jgi:hypothetical protein
MDGRAGADVVADPFRHRLQEPRGSADPVRQRRPIEVHAFASVDVALAVEGQMIAIFGDKDMSDQARTRPAAFDR